MTFVEKMRDHKVFVLFVIVGILFIYLAWLNEQRVRDLHHDEQKESQIRYSQCIERNKNWTSINTALDSIIKYERSLQPTVQNQELIAALESGHVQLIACGEPPK